MPVKPDENSSHIQIALTNGKKWHQPITVIIKNSNVLIQPTNLSHSHITMHPNIGSTKKPNSHLRISKEDINKFLVDGTNITNNGMLSEWNRKISHNFDCPLELRFSNSLIHHDAENIIHDYNTKVIQFDKGTFNLNFWFSQKDEETLTKYFYTTGVKILLFTTIEKTGENFILTYNLCESEINADEIIKAENYQDTNINAKENTGDNKSNKINLIFGLSSENKKVIILN